MAALYALLLAVVCIMQQLSGVSAFTVGFAEQDKSGDEGQNVTFTVGVSGIILGPVHVELVALTASEFEGDFGTLSDEQAATNPAERSDIFIYSPEHVFVPTSGDTPEVEDAEFQVLLIDDDLNEEREVFFLYVNVTEIENQDDRNNYNGDGAKTAAGIIRVDSDDNTEVTFGLDGGTPGLEANLYEVDESVGEVTLTLNINHPPEDDITINVEIVSPSSATEGSDLSLASTQVGLTSDETMYSVRCTITNDVIPEEEERARIQLTAQTQLTFLPEDFLIIAIIDDDMVTIGFTTDEIAIREGESAEVTVASLDSLVVELSVQLDVEVLTGTPDTGTASAGEVNTMSTFTLASTQESFTVHTSDNDMIQRDRFFTIKLSGTQANDHYTINPATLRVKILDNDTDISYGVDNTGLTVEEGDQITFPVRIFHPIPFEPDEDFVVACKVKIVYENASAADIEGSTDLGVVSLTGSSPSQDITITTEENKDLQENRVFYVILEQTSTNSPLVKLESDNATVVIEDDDSPPNKPEVTRITQNKDDFTIDWDNKISPKHPVTGYEIIITGVKEDGSTGDTTTRTAGPDDTSLTAPYDIDGTRYPMYDIIVCAVNEAGTTCSDNKPFALPLSRDDGNGGGGLSGGATAAIVIIILILLILLVVFLVVGLLWMKSRWRDYPPRKTEEKNPDFQQGRMSYGEPQP